MASLEIANTNVRHTYNSKFPNLHTHYNKSIRTITYIYLCAGIVTVLDSKHCMQVIHLLMIYAFNH